MNKFTATFSDGQTITRRSEHDYDFAWALIRIADGKIVEKGFSGTRANADKAAQGRLRTGISTRERKHPRLRRHFARIAVELGFASTEDYFAHRQAEADAYNAAHRIEIVAV